MKSLTTVVFVIWITASSLLADTATIVVGGLDGIDPAHDRTDYRVAVALSGGGARGLSSIGILRALEENDIEVAAVAGTSMGGIVGGLYACGYTPEELTDFVTEMDFTTLFANRPSRSSMFVTRRQEIERHLLTIRFDGLSPQIPQALTGAPELTSLLMRLTNRANYLAGGDFTKLPIPFKTVGTDIISGEAVVLSTGTLADAMRATMAFPLAFTGVERGERILMDGGMLVPVPVDIVRSMVSEDTPVIAVNTSSPLLSADKLISPVDIANQVTSIMVEDKLQTQLVRADVVIKPISDDFSLAEFRLRDSIIALGYSAGLQLVDSIKTLCDTWAGRGHGIDEQEHYRQDRTEIVCTDTALMTVLQPLGELTEFTRTELIADLKKAARASDAYQISARLIPIGSQNAIEPASVQSEASIPVQLKIAAQAKPLRSGITFEFRGNQVFDDSTLLEACQFPDGPLSPDDLRQASEKVNELYRKESYDLADVSDISIDFASNRIVIKIDEATVRSVSIVNNSRSKDWLIRSYFPLRRGHPYSTKRVSRGLADLYGTGLYDRITVQLTPADSGVDLTLKIKEKKYTQMRFGWHWHEEYQSEQFFEALDDNIGGIGLEYLIHGQYANDRQAVCTGFRLERLFFTYLTARARLGFESLDRDLFLSDGTTDGSRFEDRWRLAFEVGQHIARLGAVTAGISFEEIELEDNRKDTYQKFALRTLYLRSLVENLDQASLPNSGNKTSVELRLAGKLIGGEVEYTRLLGSIEFYHPLGKYVNFHPKFSIGWSRRGLPSSEKFYLGGMHSFAGFRTNELSGDKFLLFNQELRIKLPLNFYLHGRWDIGEVYTTTEEIKIRNLRHGFGTALAFGSPIGPIELGFGGGDSPKDRFYFRAGFRF